ncbi:L-rhamnonate dehydratase [Oceaniglobus trochenteri]|uniref:L-rhamnonate dehydratase n=1 Tax=Oceaniglobus trochenteri TaxID=2763260 RepID=UPI001CFFF8E8|nr:L-rhamnonate dehydratase [Oceaniglobus trochenteri]
MPIIKDIRTTIWEWTGPVAPMPPNFCTSAADIVSNTTGDISGFRFLGWLVVEIETEDGIIGLGNAALAPHAVKTLIDTQLAPMLIGQSVLDTEFLWQTMYRRTIAFGRKGIGMTAISALDIALWDAKGHVLGQPVFRLLGGRTKDKLKVYASRLYSQSLEDLAAEAQGYLDQGFTMMKLRMGWGPKDGARGMRQNIDLVRTLRETVGEDVDIMADCYMGWSLEYAREMVRRLAPYNLRWLEEPLIADDITGYAELRAMGLVPIAGGEHEFNLMGYRHLIEARAVDFAQFDTNRVGGITAAAKIAHLCEAFDVAVMPHAGQVHNYHVSLSSVTAPFAEYFPQVPVEVGNELFWYIFDGEPVAKDGHIDLPDDKPGLGLTLKEPDAETFRLIR